MRDKFLHPLIRPVELLRKSSAALGNHSEQILNYHQVAHSAGPLDIEHSSPFSPVTSVHGDLILPKQQQIVCSRDCLPVRPIFSQAATFQ